LFIFKKLKEKGEEKMRERERDKRTIRSLGLEDL